MTSRPRRHAAGRPATCSQSGISLLEVMITLAIVSAIAVPVTAWMMLGFRASDASERRLEDSNSTNIVEAFFTRDVQNAAAIAPGGPDCPGGEGAVATPGATGTVLFTVLGTAGPISTPDGAPSTSAPEATRVIYTTLTEGTPPRTALYRRSCKASPAPGDTTDSSRLAGDVRLPPGTTTWAQLATCTPRGGSPGDVCGQVALRFTGRSGEVISVAATRRVGGPWPSS